MGKREQVKTYANALIREYSWVILPPWSLACCLVLFPRVRVIADDAVMGCGG